MSQRQAEAPETRTCAIVGCETEVPRCEWPTDRSYPVICDPHLRAMQTRPHFKRLPDPVELSDLDLKRVAE